MKKYDFAIIGAGPAGSTLARELAIRKPSCSILLVDASKEERGKVCGGLLSPDAQRLMALSGLTVPKSVLSEQQIFAVDTIDLSAKIHRVYQRHYLNMDRYAFDRYLVSLIPSSVEILKSRCSSIRASQDGFSLKLVIDGKEEEVGATSVIGADGAGSIVRRSLFADKADKIERAVAYQEWFLTGGKDRLPSYSCIFDKKTSRHCSWTVRKGEYLILGGVFDKEGFRERFAEQKARLLAYLGEELPEPAKVESCFVCHPKHRRDIILGKCGAYLVGEAAGFISPSSYEGIGNAMQSAISLAEALASGKGEKECLKKYKRLTRGQRRAVRIKVYKRFLLFTPFTRRIIMKSGITAIK